MRKLRWFTPSLVLSLVLPGIAHAQTAAAWRDSSAHLSTSIRVLLDSMEKGDSGAIEIGRRGDLIVSATPNLRTEALDALDRVGELRSRWFGDSKASPAGFRIAVRIERLAPQSDAQSGVLILTQMPDTIVQHGGEFTVGAPDAAFQVASALVRVMFLSAPPSVLHWMGGPPGFWASEAERRDEVMYAFVIGIGASERECVDGVIPSCVRALALSALTPSDSGRNYYPPVRADLMLTALEMGGTGAWNRSMLDSTRSAEEVLVAASGVPLDSLISHWRSGLLDRRPNAAPVNGGGAVIAIMWAAVALLGAIGASRWA